MSPEPRVPRRFWTRFRTVRAATMDFCAPLTPEDMMVQSSSGSVAGKVAYCSYLLVLSRPLFWRSLWPLISRSPGLSLAVQQLLQGAGRDAREEAAGLVLAAAAGADSRVPMSCRRRDRSTAGARPPKIEALRRILLGLEHEQQHLELAATDIKHAFLHQSAAPCLPRTEPPTRPASTSSRRHWSGSGLRPDRLPTLALWKSALTPDPGALDAFAFDNETPRHPVYMAPFRLASRPVTCAEYLTFIEENGYERPELWLSEGWDTMQAEGWQAPLYWRRDPATPSGWSVFTMQGFKSAG